MKRFLKITTSKQVLWAVLTFCGLLAVLVMYGWLVLGRDGAPEMLAAIASIAGVVIGFYVWKAKAENLNKHGLKEKISMNGTEEYSE